MQTIGNQLKTFIFSTKLKVWKVMNNPIIFDSLNGGSTAAIDIEHMFTVIFEGGLIIVVYRNQTSDRFPATEANIALASRIRAALKNAPNPEN